MKAIRSTHFTFHWEFWLKCFDPVHFGSSVNLVSLLLTSSAINMFSALAKTRIEENTALCHCRDYILYANCSAEIVLKVFKNFI